MIPQNTQTAARLLAPLLVFGLNGCIANRMYRPVPDKAVVAVPLLPSIPADPTKPAQPEGKCDTSHLIGQPCVAFLEFDDFGETWEKNPSGRPSQLSRIIDLIGKARKQDPDGQPLILAFIHGWKHNASSVGDPGGEDSNILGLESVLNELFAKEWQGHVVIGIFVAWRGGLISGSWPVAQQFSYWNREHAASRVGNTSLTEALIEISDAAKAPANCDERDACAASPDCRPLPAQVANGTLNTGSCSPLLVIVGHSFGALVLERALSQATVTRMEQEWDQGHSGTARLQVLSSSSSAQSVAAGQSSPAGSAAALECGQGRICITPLADLVIYVNSAAAATESKQLMDYLASSGFVYHAPSKPKVDQPLFLSVTSEADIDTGLVLKIGHSPPALNYILAGSMRPKPATPPDASQPTDAYSRACFDPLGSVGNPTHPPAPWRLSDLSEVSYYMSATAHLQPLWSHLLCQLDDKGKGINAACVDALKTFPPYATYSLGESSNEIQYAVVPVVGRCNGTPYWVIQVQKEIIPDHTTIFTTRLIDFLRLFIPQPEKAGTYTRPQLTMPMQPIE